MDRHDLPGSPNFTKPYFMQLYEEEGRKKIFYMHLCILLLPLMLLDGYCVDVRQDVACSVVTLKCLYS